MAFSKSKLRVLLIQQEFNYWWTGCKWGYYNHLGVEEGLWANNVELFTLTTHWLPWAQEICAKKKFDQVWINDLVHLDVEENFMQWVSDLAPVRLGFSIESFEYTADDYVLFPGLKNRQAGIEMRLKYVTHLVAYDEKDAASLNRRGNLSAIWSPQAVPKRYFTKFKRWDPEKPVVFRGTLYGERRKWLEHPVLKTMLTHTPSPDKGTWYPFFYNSLSIAMRHGYNNFRLPAKIALPIYLSLLRYVRRSSFRRWLREARNYCAIVNLPSLFKGYAGHVAEGMVAGRPVISWRIPERPRTAAVFAEDKEILLFDRNDADQLVRQIKRVKTEPGLAQRLIYNSQEKMLRLHTMEKRVGQILDWIESAKEPVYE